MSTHLALNRPLHTAIRYPGALTVLRWVVGSCRAYLKETRPGEGVVNDPSQAAASNAHAQAYGNVHSENIRQFSFVVGDPEQEDGFRKEIETAKKGKKGWGNYPTMLAFHGQFDDTR